MQMIKQKKFYIPFLIFLVCLLSVHFTQTKNGDRQPASLGSASPRRIVAYIADWSIPKDDYLKERAVTHYIYSFVIPKLTNDGYDFDLLLPRKLMNHKKHLMEDVKLKNTPQIMMAVGGYSYQGKLIAPTLKKIVTMDNGINRFSDRLIQTCEQYDLDGIDIDWEFPKEDDREIFASFLKNLKQKMDRTRKCNTLSIAVSTRPEDINAYGADWIPSVDFVNLMAYDYNKGPHHSSYEHSQFALLHWNNKGVPIDKLVLGIPLYSKPHIMKYSDIIALDPANAMKDHVKKNGKNLYYNGEETTRKKALLGLGHGGVMVWEIGQDSISRPLLKTIENQIIDN